MIQTALIPDPLGPDALAEVRRQVAALQRTQTVIGANSIDGGSALVAGSVTTGSLAAGSVTTSILAAGAVVTSTLAAGAVTAVKIQASTITSNEIAAGTILGSNIAASTVTATNIAAGTITSSLLAANSVTSTAIVAGAVTATKISVSQLSAIAADLGTITAGTITGATVQTATSGARVVTNSGGITAYNASNVAQLNFSTSTGNLTLSGAVTANSSSVIPTTTLTGTLTTGQIGTGNVTSTNILDGTVAGTDIAANTITASNIVAATITATELAANSVTSVKILANTIVAGNIASGTITATQIASGTITATQLTSTAIDGMTITGSTIRTSSGTSRIEMNGTNLRVVVSGADAITLDPTNGMVVTQGTGAQNTITWKDSARTTTYGFLRSWDTGSTRSTQLMGGNAGAGSAYIQLSQGYSGGIGAGYLTSFRSTSTTVYAALNVIGEDPAVYATTSAGITNTLVDALGNMSAGGGITSRGLGVITTNGAGTYKVTRGTVTATWPGGNAIANQVTVPHGLATTPAAIIVTPQNPNDWVSFYVTAIGTTNFNIATRAMTGTPGAGTTVVYNWVAFT